MRGDVRPRAPGSTPPGLTSGTQVVLESFPEIHAGWLELLSAGHAEQGAWAIVRRAVRDRPESEGHAPASAAAKDRLEKMVMSRRGGEASEVPRVRPGVRSRA